MVEPFRAPEPPAELLVAFANSEDHEEGTDDLTGPPRPLTGSGLAGQRFTS